MLVMVLLCSEVAGFRVDFGTVIFVVFAEASRCRGEIHWIYKLGSLLAMEHINTICVGQVQQSA